MARRPRRRPRPLRRSPGSPARFSAAEVERGLALHRSGDLAGAERHYRTALESRPDYPDALHLLGVVAHERGRSDAALELIEHAIAGNPNAALYHNNLGEALRALERHQEAEGAYRRALDLAPRDPDTLNNLGLLLAESGREPDALRLWESALARAPGLAPVRFNLARAYAHRGRHERALSLLGPSKDLRRAPLEVRKLAGRALMNLGRFDEGAALLATGEAEGCDGEADRLLAECELQRGDRHAARIAAEGARRLAPGSLTERILGEVALAFGELEDAAAHLERAVRTETDPARLGTAWLRLGECRQMAGRFSEAEAAHLESIEQPGSPFLAFEGLSQCRKYGPDDVALMERLETALDERSRDEPTRSAGLFAAGKLREDLGDLDRAFEHYRRANETVRARVPYDPAGHARLVDRIIETFDRAAIEALGGAGHPSEAPIFIVGLPRSGTTLVEQILSCHPECHGGGEIVFFDALKVDGLGFPEMLPALLAAPGRLEHIAERYLDRLREESNVYPRITDKMPSNFLYIGLLAALFPRSPVICCTRDPLDTCWSIYRQSFTNERGNAFAFSFEGIAGMYRDYRRLVSHWNAVLGPKRLHAVCYEQLVAAPEPGIRALLAHCGLPWEPACLAPHRNPRAVGTASNWQVRQPLNPASVNRAARFGAALAPLRRLLESGAPESEIPSP